MCLYASFPFLFFQKKKKKEEILDLIHKFSLILSKHDV